MRIFGMTLALALASGCTFEANTEVEGSFEIELGPLGTDCSGDGAKTTALGTSTWTKSNDGTRCSIRSDWRGNLVDMPMVRAKVEEELKKNGSSLDKAEVNFDAVELTFHDIYVAPGMTVEKVALSVAVESESLMIKEVPTLAELTAMAAFSRAQVQKALEAFQKNTPLLGTGNTTFTVPMAALAGGGPDAKVVVPVTVKVSSKLTIKQL